MTVDIDDIKKAADDIKKAARLRILEKSLDYATESASSYLAENIVLREGLTLIAGLELTPYGHIAAGKKVYTQDKIDEIKQLAKLYLSKAAEAGMKNE